MSNILSFEGRISLKPYWILVLVIFIGTIITTVIDMNMTGQETGLTTVLFTLIILWPALAIQVKRWHDRDKSGWWVLINLVPIIGPIWAIIENGFLPGTEGRNLYGENPLN